MTEIAQLTIGDIASREVFTVTPDRPLAQVVALFAQHRVSCVIVTENRLPRGIITERDLLRLLCTGFAADRTAQSIMVAPLLTVREDLDFSVAQTMLANRGIRHLVLVNAAGELQGVVSETDFRRHIGSDLFASIEHLGAVMLPASELVDPDRPLLEVVEHMSSRRLDHVLIGRGERALGILTERDIPPLILAGESVLAMPVSRVMSAPLLGVPLATPVATAAGLMAQRGVRHLVVEREGAGVVGVLSQHQLLERLGAVLLEERHDRLSGQLGLILEYSGIGTWEMACDSGRMVAISSLSRLFGEPLVHPFPDLDTLLERVAPEDAQRVRASFARAREDAAHRIHEDCRLTEPGGRSRWFGVRGRALATDAAGRPQMLGGVLIDIGREKQALQEAAHDRDSLRLLIGALPMPVVRLDAAGRVEYANAHFRAMFGLDGQEVTDLEGWWRAAFPDESRRAQARRSWAGSEGADGTLRPADHEITARDGSRRTVQISGIRQGQAWLIVFVDVTARVHADAELTAQLAELRRWQEVMLDREERLIGLKQEVNALLARLGEPARYPSAGDLPS